MLYRIRQFWFVHQNHYRKFPFNLLYWLCYNQRVFVYKKAKLSVRSGGTLDIGGKRGLLVGVQIPGGLALDTIVLIRRGGKLYVRDRFFIYSGASITVTYDAVLMVDDCKIGRGSAIFCSHHINIGKGVIIGAHTVIRDTDSHKISYDGYTNQEVRNEINIEDHVWIGMRCIILKGVTIGTGSVIAAGAIVTRDIPPHCLAGGIPAKVIKENIQWKE